VRITGLLVTLGLTQQQRRPRAVVRRLQGALAVRPRRRGILAQSLGRFGLTGKLLLPGKTAVALVGRCGSQRHNHTQHCEAQRCGGVHGP